MSITAYLTNQNGVWTAFAASDEDRERFMNAFLKHCLQKVVSLSTAASAPKPAVATTDEAKGTYQVETSLVSSNGDVKQHNVLYGGGRKRRLKTLPPEGTRRRLKIMPLVAAVP